MPDVLVRGRRIAYAVKPLEFDGSDPAVVFIHGSGGDREDWRAQLDGLSPALTAIALELPGHGKSEPPGETSVEAYTGWVVDFIEALGLQRTALVGCSLGSAVTQLAALSPRPWLKAIGLAGAGARLRVLPLLLQGLIEEPESTLNAIREFCLSPSAPHFMRQGMKEKLATVPADLFHKDFSACNGFDVMKHVHEIHLPTCIIVGADDKLTPVKYSQFLHDKISGSLLHVIPGAGHLVMIEKPRDFNRCLAEFFRDIGLTTCFS
ncbi:MAG: alpha/beta fold hydrolase [Pseudomonadota bacterium]